MILNIMIISKSVVPVCVSSVPLSIEHPPTLITVAMTHCILDLAVIVIAPTLVGL
jgi:hypothetical protein